MKVRTVTIFSMFVLTTGAVIARVSDPLPSWNDTGPKQAIITFVEKVTREKSPDFVPPVARIAVFDNDGTLWAEQPMYFQAFFVFDRIRTLAPQHPEWKDKEPFASVLRGDMETALSGGEHALVEMAMATHAGMTTEEFESIVSDWIASARHPKTGKLYTEMIYQPMLEVLNYLRANGFKTFIVSGGGIEFMRPWTEKVYGIPPEQVIGSSIKTQFEIRNGNPVLVRLPEMNFIDDKAGKPVGIQMHIGRRPIAALGNSDGDLQMLQWTAAGKGVRFCLYVHHTDAEREWAYDRQSSIGKLDKGLDEAKAKGWTLASMKDDWKRIYPFDVVQTTAKAGQTGVDPNVLGKLIGQWVRPDGGDVIRITSVNPDGQIQTAYFNPNPINVSKAMVTRDVGRIKVFVEPQDEGYPVTYAPANDRLSGTCFQTQAQQIYEVAFQKNKSVRN